MNRGVSTVVSYVIALTITAALIGGLLLATGELVEGRQETTAQASLEIAGERLAAAVMAADRLAASGADTVVVEASLPDRVAGGSYTVTVNDSANAHFLLESRVTGTEINVSVANRTDIAGGTAPGGDLEVVLSGETLEVQQR